MVNKRQIYFAAPLFTQAEWLWNLELAEKLRAFNFDIILPQLRAEPMLLKKESFDPLILFAANVQEIDQADIVLAILDQADPDSGTCWECGYAYKAGKPIIGLRTDIRNGADDPSGVNLMLFHSCAEFLLVPPEKRSDVDWVAIRISELVNQLK